MTKKAAGVSGVEADPSHVKKNKCKCLEIFFSFFFTLGGVMYRIVSSPKFVFRSLNPQT